MTELIITEKPSSAKKVAEALADSKPTAKKNKQATYYELTHNGKQITVTSAVGHLYGLAERNKNGWSYPVFDIAWVPSYEMAKNLDYVKIYLNTITALAKKAEEFTIACDYDVEGEVIGLNVIRFACLQKDASRMKFSTLTKQDLVMAYEKKLSHMDWGQALAGETRHKLDWFYGINLSRALTSSVKAAGSFKVMSAGRVQGPALKLLVDREREIRAFVPEPFWQISLQGKYQKEPVEAWHVADKIFERPRVEEILHKVKDQKTAIIKTINRIRRNQLPPNPFNLTTLQAESYAQFKITPKETLAIAQNLYLAGVTSYPRTSSQQLDPKLGFAKIFKDLARQPVYEGLCNELLSRGTLKPNNGKKTDPAHPAIYPTGQRPGALKPREQKVYDLIVKRFMATFAKPAVRETMQAALDVNSEEFIAKGTRTVEENWHVFYKPYLKLEEVELPAMQEKETIAIAKIEKHDKETQPPKRFNQSSIIKELEKRNLGTKATRADILDRLFQRGYIEGIQITVTELGMETIRLLEKYAPTIIDEKLTVDFEEDMEEIREGKEKQENVLAKAKKFLVSLLADFKQKEKSIGEEIIKSIKETWDAANYMGNCPKCGSGRLMVKRGRFGRFIACDKYPDCKVIINVPKTGVLKFTGEMDEATKYPIVEVGSGRRRQKVTLMPAEKKQETDGPAEKQFPEEGMACPTCKEGQMVLRKSFYGQFLGCNKYPKCQTMMKIIEGKVDVKNPIVKGRKKTTDNTTVKAAVKGQKKSKTDKSKVKSKVKSKSIKEKK